MADWRSMDKNRARFVDGESGDELHDPLALGRRALAVVHRRRSADARTSGTTRSAYNGDTGSWAEAKAAAAAYPSTETIGTGTAAGTPAATCE